MLKINFGSGSIAPQGWISMDSSPSALLAKVPYSKTIKNILGNIGVVDKQILKTEWPKNITYWDLRWGIPFRKGTVDIIFASHFIEHLPKNAADKFLKNCYEILKTGGILRLVIPDIDILVKTYLKQVSENPIAASEELNARFFEGSQHKWMYNLQSLKEILKNVGFKNIKKFDYRKSKIKDIHKLETPELKYYTSLYLEAEK